MAVEGTALIDGAMAAVFGAFAGSAGRTAAFDILGAGRSTADMTAGCALGCTASVFTGSSVGRERSGCACFLALVVPAASDPFLGAGDFVSAFADSEPFMTWKIGDHGFEMGLSPRVPKLIATNLRPWLEGPFYKLP